MRVLMAAFACHPERGSEPGVGWAVAAGAARAGHDVVVVTQPRNRLPIEAARRGDAALTERLHPVYTGLPGRLVDAWDRSLSLRGLQLYYIIWQLPLWLAARRVAQDGPFDVAHHVTLSADWVPSGLAWVRGVPLVWGPVGGAERVPATCRQWLRLRGRLREAVREVTAVPMRSVFGAATARRAALVVAQDPESAATPARAGATVTVRPNAFIDAHRAPVVRPPDQGPRRARTAVFAGRLVSWKGVHLAVTTMAQPAVAHWQLHIYGDGPERKPLQRRIARMGLSGRVVLLGHRPRGEVRAAMASADAFFYPSFRDAAPWVVAEALTAGCPVVCIAVGAPPILVGGTGEALEPGPRMVERLAQALLRTESGHRASARWTDEALPGLLTSWYASAIGAKGRLRVVKAS